MNTPVKDLFALANEAANPVIWSPSKARKKFDEAATPERVREVASEFAALEARVKELEADKKLAISNYDAETYHRRQISENWRRLAAASGWIDARDQHASNNDLPRKFDSAVEMAASWKQRAETAEAELERLKAQEPVAYTSQENIDAVTQRQPKTLEFMTGDKSVYRNPVPLFTRAATAEPRPAVLPQRFVVKLPEEHGTVFIGGVGVRVFSEPSIIEVLKAAGGEIAE